MRTHEVRLTPKRILHQTHDRAETVLLRSHDLIDELSTAVRVCGDQRLLAHVGRELVLCHVVHLTGELGDDHGAVLGLPMLQDKLNDVVLIVTVSFIKVATACTWYSPRTDQS